MNALRNWWQGLRARIVPGFTKSWAWLASLAGVLIAYGPDLAAFIIDHIDLISTVVPTFPAWLKALILLAAHLGVLFLRPIKQANMPQPTTPVAIVKVPETLDLGAVAVPTEVQKTSTGGL